MKPRTPGLWLIAAIIGLLSQMPTSAFAGMTPEEVKAFEGYKAKAEKGNAEAQYNLGESYDNGDGVPKDEVEGVKWYRKAADQGYDRAQFILGVCYASGTGVTKDEVEGVKWYRKAADQGHVRAQHNLGVHYYEAEDAVEAVKCCLLYTSPSPRDS